MMLCLTTGSETTKPAGHGPKPLIVSKLNLFSLKIVSLKYFSQRKIKKLAQKIHPTEVGLLL
jgi:hypothetical protein